MNPDETLKLIDQLPLFEDFTPEEKRELSKLDSHIASFLHKDTIISQGEISQNLFVLLDGEVIITKREAPEIVLNTLHPGDLFGEVPLISGSPRLTNAISKGNSAVLKLDHIVYENLSLSIANKLNKILLKLLIGRLDEMNAAMAGLKSEFQSFVDAYNHVRNGIDKVVEASSDFKKISDSFSQIQDGAQKIIQATSDLKMVQNLSYSYFNKLRK